MKEMAIANEKKIAEAKEALEQEARERAVAEKALVEAKLEERRRQEEARGKKFGGRPPQVPDPEQAKPDPKAQRNFTDPDSRIMKDGATKEFVQAYNAQAAVDSHAQVIVGAAVTRQFMRGDSGFKPGGQAKRFHRRTGMFFSARYFFTSPTV